MVLWDLFTHDIVDIFRINGQLTLIICNIQIQNHNSCRT